MCILYIYIYMYVYVVSKVNSFLANLCSIPPRKCDMSLQQIPMVVLLQQSVPPIYATCFSKKYSMKPRSLSRTWPNISKLEHTVLILRPSMFIAAVVKRLVPASLNAWSHRTASVQKLQMAESDQNQKKTWKKQKTQFSESLGWPPPLPKSLEILFFSFQGFYQVWGTSRKLAWITGKAVKVPLGMQ